MFVFVFDSIQIEKPPECPVKEALEIKSAPKPCPFQRSLWRSFVNVVIPICYKGSTRRSIYSHLDRMVVNFGMVGKRTSNCGTRLKSLVAGYHIFLMIFNNAK